MITTIYVDDDNTNGPWYGTLEHPYRFIQDAVDNATNGDAVFVSSGMYQEHVVIATSIQLLGEEKTKQFLTETIMARLF